MPSVSAVAEGLRRASPMALRLMAARSDISLTGKTDEQLIAEIMRYRGIEEAPPAPAAPAVAVRIREVVRAEPQRAPVGKHSFLMGPGEKPEAVSSEVSKQAAAAASAEAAILASKYSFLVGSRAPREEIALVWPKKREVVAAKMEVPASPGKYSFLTGPGQEAAAPAAPVEQIKLHRESAVMDEQGKRKSGRYGFLMGPGEVPEAGSSETPNPPMEAEPELEPSEQQTTGRKVLVRAWARQRAALPPNEQPVAETPAPAETPEAPSVKVPNKYAFLLGPEEVPEKRAL